MTRSFRLLMELYSFLPITTPTYIKAIFFPSPYGVSFILMRQANIIHTNDVVCFRLLMEYHSFLF